MAARCAGTMTWACLGKAGRMMAAGEPGQALVDPTGPPSAAASGSGAQDELPAGRQLQSILFSGGRKLATVDGTTAPLGGMIGNARVVKITETEVTLRTGDETEVLKLYPAVNRQAVKRAASRQRDTDAGAESSGHGGAK